MGVVYIVAIRALIALFQMLLLIAKEKMKRKRKKKRTQGIGDIDINTSRDDNGRGMTELTTYARTALMRGNTMMKDS